MQLRDVLVCVVLSATLILDLSCGSARAADGVTVLVAYHSETGNTEKMAQGVVEGIKAIPGTRAVLKKVGEITSDDLLACDALIVGSPVYFGNMAGEVKSFFDGWAKMGLFQDRKMRNKIGAAFATGASVSNGKELTMISIYAAMLINQMVVTSGGGGLGASATTGQDSRGIDEKELAEASALGTRIAEVASIMKRGAANR